MILHETRATILIKEMLLKNFQRNFIFLSKNPARIFVWLLLLVIGGGSLNFQSFQTPVSPNLVYCPLQKQWVKPDEPRAKIERPPFDEICATDARKSSLQFELALKTPRPLTEKIVFDYLERGDRLIAELNGLSGAPEQRFDKQTNFEKAASNFSQKPGKFQIVNFTLPQAARPPNPSDKSADFGFQFVRPLVQISRNINPRSPPVFS